MKKTIRILDYSEFPGLRHSTISDDSGEDYYHKVLNSEFKDIYEEDGKLEVVLDYVDAYTSSFLDEAFGNLVYDFSLEIVKKHLEIVSEEEPHWVPMIMKETFPQWEDRRKRNQVPIVTKKHDPWFRLIDKELVLKEWESPAQ